MRLPGVRVSAATLGLGLVGAAIGVLGAGSTGHTTPAAPVTYEVEALLLSVEGGPVYACYSMNAQVPNVIEYRNGTLLTPRLDLIGTWDGHALTLTEPPRPATSARSLPAPCTQQPGTSAAGATPPRQVQVLNDEAVLVGRGIQVIQTVTCGDTLGIYVLVADPATVRYLEIRYGKVGVAGWLQPLPSGP